MDQVLVCKNEMQNSCLRNFDSEVESRVYEEEQIAERLLKVKIVFSFLNSTQNCQFPWIYYSKGSCFKMKWNVKLVYVPAALKFNFVC